ncbi:MAG: ADP-ribosylglycohydrolase family protein, partial [Desulfovibrio sp.]|nr:ADP-ribosylglycohydrolase family protein [Desulfovibrio sp.]
LFAEFRAHEAEAATALDAGAVVWKEAGKDCRFYVQRPVEPKDESSWPEAVDWLCAMSLRLKNLAQKWGKPAEKGRSGSAGLPSVTPSPELERMMETILLGLAVGDATGVPFEFLQRGTFKAESMQGGGAHGQPAGTWSDDTALALAFADSLRSGGFDAEQAGRNFQDWLYKAEFTARGEVFDVGSATRTAILRMRQGVQPEQAGGTGEYDNGNGSLMRIAPIVPALLDVKEPEARYEAVRRASSLTHAHPLACACCFVFAEYLRLLSLGWDRDTGYRRLCADFADGFPFIEGEVLAKLGRVLDGSLPYVLEPEIQSGGFVLHTLEAALWCLLNSDSYEETVLKAVGLGRDADTTACVAGAIAAVCWGRDSIPADWVEGLAGRDELLRIARKAAEQIRSGGTGMKK